MEGLIRDLSAEYLLEWSLLCAILTVGCHTAYTDIHWRQIGNWSTWGLLVLGVERGGQAQVVKAVKVD